MVILQNTHEATVGWTHTADNMHKLIKCRGGWQLSGCDGLSGHCFTVHSETVCRESPSHPRQMARTFSTHCFTVQSETVFRVSPSHPWQMAWTFSTHCFTVQSETVCRESITPTIPLWSTVPSQFISATESLHSRQPPQLTAGEREKGNCCWFCTLVLH